MSSRAYFYDSRDTVTAEELQVLYGYTAWGRSRGIAGIKRMLQGTDLCFSARIDGRLVGFCRMLTDYIYRGALYDIMVHPDYQGRGLGTALLDYALTHPLVKDLPMIMTYTTGLGEFLSRRGFVQRDGQYLLARAPRAEW